MAVFDYLTPERFRCGTGTCVGTCVPGRARVPAQERFLEVFRGSCRMAAAADALQAARPPAPRSIPHTPLTPGPPSPLTRSRSEITSLVPAHSEATLDEVATAAWCQFFQCALYLEVRPRPLWRCHAAAVRCGCPLLPAVSVRCWCLCRCSCPLLSALALLCLACPSSMSAGGARVQRLPGFAQLAPLACPRPSCPSTGQDRAALLFLPAPPHAPPRRAALAAARHDDVPPAGTPPLLCRHQPLAAVTLPVAAVAACMYQHPPPASTLHPS